MESKKLWKFFFTAKSVENYSLLKTFKTTGNYDIEIVLFFKNFKKRSFCSERSFSGGTVHLPSHSSSLLSHACERPNHIA